ncbi:hypothetical protein AVDCRST_MAG84-1168, partial [uncultured Microcoleus sp.]
ETKFPSVFLLLDSCFFRNRDRADRSLFPCFLYSCRGKSQRLL